MRKTRSSNAAATVSAPFRNGVTTARGKFLCKPGFQQKKQEVAVSSDHMEEVEESCTSQDVSALASSQSVACEVVWDCVSPGPPVPIGGCGGSSTPGEGNAPRRLRKRSLIQRTPARSTHLSAAKAKKTSGLAIPADTIPAAKCTARLLFFKNAVPTHDNDTTISTNEPDEIEAMDIMELSPIACLTGLEADVAAAVDVTAAQCAAGPSSAPSATVAAANMSTGSPPTTPKMNQSFSCKNSASVNRGSCSRRIHSFDDEDSLFSDSIVQSTQAIEEALFDKSNNRFLSPAAVGKALSKIQPAVINGKLLEVKQCNSPLSRQENSSYGAKRRSVPLLKPESDLTVNKLPNHSVDINTQMENQLKEPHKFPSDPRQILSKELVSKDTKENSKFLNNTENVVDNISIGSNRKQLSNCSSGFKSGSTRSGYAIETGTQNGCNKKLTNQRNGSYTSNVVINGTADAAKSTVTKVAIPSGGKTSNNQAKMQRSRSVYSTGGIETTAPVAMVTVVRRVHSDSAVLNFSDSDPEFEEIASSIPDNEELLMPWSQQLLQKTRLKLDRNKGMQRQLSDINEVLSKSIQRRGSSQGSCLSSVQPSRTLTNNLGQNAASQSISAGLVRNSDTESVSLEPSSTSSSQLIDDADFFDDGFGMEDDDALNNFLSQVEGEYVSASQAVIAADSLPSNEIAEKHVGNTRPVDKTSKLNNKRDDPLNIPDNGKQLNANCTNQPKDSRVTLHNNSTKLRSDIKVPIRSVPSNLSNSSISNLNTIPPNHSTTSTTKNKYESTPKSKYTFRNKSSLKNSSVATDFEPRNGGLPLLNRPQCSISTANNNGAKAEIIRTSSTVLNKGGPREFVFQNPNSTTTQCGSKARITRSSNTNNRNSATVVISPESASSSTTRNIAATSTCSVVPSLSSSAHFGPSMPVNIVGGLPGAASGNKAKYTKEQIAMKKALAIERQKALLQCKSRKGGIL